MSRRSARARRPPVAVYAHTMTFDSQTPAAMRRAARLSSSAASKNRQRGAGSSSRPRATTTRRSRRSAGTDSAASSSSSDEAPGVDLFAQDIPSSSEEEEDKPSVSPKAKAGTASSTASKQEHSVSETADGEEETKGDAAVLEPLSGDGLVAAQIALLRVPHLSDAQRRTLRAVFAAVLQHHDVMEVCVRVSCCVLRSGVVWCLSTDCKLIISCVSRAARHAGRGSRIGLLVASSRGWPLRQSRV